MMKAVIETSTGRAFYLFSSETVTITPTGMTGPIRALDIKSGTHSVVDVSAPERWVGGGVLAWVDDAWAIHNQTAFDAATAVTPEQVTAERDRRLQLDFEFNGATFQRDHDAVRRINGAGTLALAAIVGGAQSDDYRWHGGDSDFQWIASDNTLVTMDAQTVMLFGAAAAHRETELIFAAKLLKAEDPIPDDYTDDAYWP